MNRPLLIGQAPGPNTDPDLPLFPLPKTSAGGRLQQMTGLTRGKYFSTFDRINVLNYFPGQVKRDDKFPASPAKFAAATLKTLMAGRTVIMVGRKVAEAFGHEAEFLDWSHMLCRRNEYQRPGICQVAIVPHTSGRNHWYNDIENRKAAEGFWRQFRLEHLGE